MQLNFVEMLNLAMMNDPRYPYRAINNAIQEHLNEKFGMCYNRYNTCEEDNCYCAVPDVESGKIEE